MRDAVSKGARVVTGGKRGPRGCRALLRADRARRRRPLDALHDRGDLRADAAGDEGRRRRGGDPARQRRALRAPGVGVDARHRDGGEARPPRSRPASAASTTPRSTTSRSSCRWAAGRRRGSGPATGPTGSASTPSASRSWSRPATRRRARSTCFPYSAEVTEQIGAGDQRPGHQRAVHRRPAADAARLLRHDRPVAASRPAGSNGAGDPHGFWARAASHLGVPEAIELALLQSGAPAGAARRAAPSCSTRSRSKGMVADAPQEAREAIVHAFADSGPEALAGIHALRGLTLSTLLRAARPRHRPEPELGRDRLPGAAARSRPPSRSRSRVRRPAAGERRMRSRPTSASSARAPGGGVIAGTLAAARQAGVRARDGRLLQRGRLRPARAGATRASTCAAARSRPPTARSRSRPARRSAAARVINWQNCLRTTPGCARSGHASIGLEGLDGPEFDRYLDEPCGAPRRERLLLRPQRAAPAAEGGLRGARLRLPAHHPQRRPGSPRPRPRRLRRLRRRDGREAVDHEDLPRRRPRARRRPGRELPGRADPGRGRDARRGSRAPTPAPTGRRPASWSARRRSSSPAARSSRRRCCCARGSAAPPSATTCDCTRRARSSPSTTSRRIRGGDRRSRRSRTSSPTSTDGYGFLIEGGHHSARHQRRGDALAVGAPAQGGDARLRDTSGLINLTRDRGHGRVDVDAAGNAVPTYRLTDDLDIANFRRGRGG